MHFFRRKDASFRRHYTNLNEDRPINRPQIGRPTILVSGDIKLMGVFMGFLLAETSNESGVVDDGNFGHLSGCFLGIFRDKASNII